MREIYYGSKILNRDNKEYWSNIYPTAGQVRLCGKPTVHTLKVTISPDQSRDDLRGIDYWGWVATDTDAIAMIQTNFIGLKMCFPYGLEKAEAHGAGKAYKLIVEEIQEVSI
jgi:hypothetical protein